MHIGGAQQRIRWGPHRIGRNAGAMKLQGSQRSEGQAEKNVTYLHQEAAGTLLCMDQINRRLWRTCEPHGVFQYLSVCLWTRGHWLSDDAEESIWIAIAYGPCSRSAER